MSTIPLVTEDEREVILTSARALLHLAERLNGTVFAPRSLPTTTATVTGIESTGNTPTRRVNFSNPSVVRVEDGVGFVELLSEVVAHYTTSLKPTGEREDSRRSLRRETMNRDARGATDVGKTLQREKMALRHLLFEVQPDLIATVLSILHAPHMMGDDDVLSRLFCGVLRLLQGVVLACCPVSEGIGENAQEHEGVQEVAWSIEALELAATTTDLLDRVGVVHIVTGLLFDEYPIAVRLAAVQLLFVLLLRDSGGVPQVRSGYVRGTLATAEHLSILLSILSSLLSTSAPSMVVDTLLSLRLHAAACLRELANTHFAHLTQMEVLDVLRRVADTDVSGDMRALCIESLHVILQRNTSISCWARVPFKKELVAFCSRQLERESHHDALRATMCLVETLIIKDSILTAVVTHSSGSSDCAPLNRDVAPMAIQSRLGEESVCEVFLALFADRALATIIGDSPAVFGGTTKYNKVSHNRDRTPLSRLQRETANTPRNLPQQQQQPHYMRRRGHSPRGRTETTPTTTATTTATVCIATSTASLAARCLRLLLQYAPFYRYAAFNLIQHRSSTLGLLEVGVRLAEVHETAHSLSEAALGLAVELALLFGLALAQDPRARQLLASEFHDYHGEAQQVRRALISNLNLVLLSYLSNSSYSNIGYSSMWCRADRTDTAREAAAVVAIGFPVVDVTGVRMNALDGVVWDSPGHPSRASVHDLFTLQEGRWNSGGEKQRRRKEEPGSTGCYKIPHTMDVDRSKFVMSHTQSRGDGIGIALTSPDECRQQRLTFIVLSYAIHYTFKFACDGGAATLNFSAALRGTTGSTDLSYTTTATAAAATMRGKVTAATESVKATPSLLASQSRKKPQRYCNEYLVRTVRRTEKASQPQEQERGGQHAETSAVSPAPRNPREGAPNTLKTTAACPEDDADGNKGGHRRNLICPPTYPQQNSNNDDIGDHNTSTNVDHSIPQDEVHMFLRFHRSFCLFRDLALFYEKYVGSTSGHLPVVYEATGEKGMVRRLGRREARRTLAKLIEASGNRHNPPNAPPRRESLQPEVLYQQHQHQLTSMGRGNPGCLRGTKGGSWSVNELQEGDLFYFHIPWSELTIEALQFTRREALAHTRRIKQMFAITPQFTKARRWLLHDIVTNIMPGVVHALSQFIQWFDVHGAESIKLPLLLYFQSDAERGVKVVVNRQECDGGNITKNTVTAGISPQFFTSSVSNKQQGDDDDDDNDDDKASSLPQPEDVALHSGNLILLLQQLAFYLERRNHEVQEGQQETFIASPCGGILGNRGVSQCFQSPSVGRKHKEAEDKVTATETGGLYETTSPKTKRSAFLDDIEQEIERLQNMEFRGDEDVSRLTETFLLPGAYASPYNTLHQNSDSRQNNEADERKTDSEEGEEEEEEDEFDEEKGF